MRTEHIVARAGVVFLGGLIWGAQQANAQPGAQVGADGEAGVQSATTPSATTSPSAGTVVPRLVQFNGVVSDATGKPASGTVTITFSLYELQEGGTPLWTETQSVVLDEQGRYMVFLGAASPSGLPLDLFASGSARWLGVAPAVPGVGEQQRVLLVGVPYALKAADADTLGGLPASAFVQTATAPGMEASSSAAGTGSKAIASGSAESGQQRGTPKGKPSATVADYIPYWNGGTTFGNSAMYQSGGNIGIGTTNPVSLLNVAGKIYSSGSAAEVSASDRTTGLQYTMYGTGGVMKLYRGDVGDVVNIDSSGYVGIGTTNPVSLLNVAGKIYSSGSAAEVSASDRTTGLQYTMYGTGGVMKLYRGDVGDVVNINSSGHVGIGTSTPAATLEVNGTAKFDRGVTFASGQTFPGAASLGSNNFVGNETITGNLAVASNGTISLGTTGGGLAIQPNALSPNVIAGFSGNSVVTGFNGAVIAGGGSISFVNVVNGDQGVVGGGEGNTAGELAVVGGGTGNVASGLDGTIGGGYSNGASNDFATVSGGELNTVSGFNATVGGGDNNTASGTGATVPGGGGNTASGNYSLAAGAGAQAFNDGSFVWADDSGLTVSDTGANSFVARASGGFVLYTNSGATTGATLAAGSGSWSSLSDRNLKANFTSVDGVTLLARLSTIPVLAWNYRAQPSSVRHLGPMAQDFHAAFGLGEDDKHISTVDAEGVALAAIQELYKRSQQSEVRGQRKDGEIRELYRLNLQKDAQIRQLTAKVAKLESLERQMVALQARLDRLEAGNGALEAKNRNP